MFLMTLKEYKMKYRQISFSSAVTVTVAPLHHTPWAEAMDDSKEAFLKTKS